jgi:hypothetical protein
MFNKAFFQKRFMDEVWVVSRQTPEIRQELRWAEEFSIPAIDAYKNTTSAQVAAEMEYNLKFLVLPRAKEGMMHFLDENSSGPKETQDKSGLTDDIIQTVNYSLNLIRSQISSLADSCQGGCVIEED